MQKVRFALLAVLLLALALVLPASAQDAQPVTVDPDGNLAIQQDIQTQATVDVKIGDQVYRITVPVAVKIDAAVPLAGAQVAAPAARQVGEFLVEPVSVQRIKGEYQKDFRTVTPASPDNVVVVFIANLTNMSSETQDVGFPSILTTTAVDDAGNTYDEEARICDSIDPNETISCQFIFDAPSTANLVDLKVETMARQQFNFSGLEAEE